jgi:DNA mismatch repair ATPase MutS
MELIKITILLEPLLMFSSIKTLQSKAVEIEEVYQFVGEIDVLISIASMRSGLDSFCIPEISSDVQRFSFDELKHPLVVDCVANNLQIEKSILLTGSNMSGKSTFMRSIGLNYLSGLCLNTCFAKKALIPRAKLFTIMRIEDDIMLSSSYFLKEVSEMKNVLTQLSSHQQAIILLDELFKGTNTKERIAAAKAILSYLNKKNVRVLVATHDIELTKLLENEFDLYYFSESFTDSNYYYDYKLKPGIPKNGNAIRILAINQFPQEIIQHANELLK